MNKEKIKWSEFNLNNKNVSDKINAMDSVLNFINSVHWIRADNAHYPNFIVDIWDEEKDYYFNEYLDSNCSIPVFYSNLDRPDKIKLLSYIINYNSTEPLI